MSGFSSRIGQILRRLTVILSILVFLGAVSGSVASAQFSVLHHFSRGVDGEDPIGGITVSGDVIFGTSGGGVNNRGLIWSFNTTAASFVNLHDFGSTDGSGPRSGVAASGKRIFGTASVGGSTNAGTIWSVDTVNATFHKLHDFVKSIDPNMNEGASPRGALALSDGLLFGVNYTAELGSLWQLDTSTNSLTVLHRFTGGADGGLPEGGVTASGSFLFGATRRGIWSYDRITSTFDVLYNFVPGDSGEPLGNIVVDENILYGTNSGGIGGLGTIWSLDTTTGSFTTLHRFNGVTDGRNPQGSIAFDGTTLYGTANPTVWSLNTDTGLFNTLYTFNLATDGSKPDGGLVLSGRTLYGANVIGGTFGDGTLWSYVIPEPSTAVLVIVALMHCYLLGARMRDPSGS